MKLFEVVNGFTGESYVRAYAWAETPEQAIELAREHFKTEEMRNWNPRPAYWERLQAIELFDGNAAPFATYPNDYGWPEEPRTS